MTGDLGLRIRAMRDARGMTRKALAAKAGIAADTLRDIESGRSGTAVGTLYALADGLDVPVEQLFADTRTVFSTAKIDKMLRELAEMRKEIEELEHLLQKKESGNND